MLRTKIDQWFHSNYEKNFYNLGSVASRLICGGLILANSKLTKTIHVPSTIFGEEGLP